LPCQQKGVNKKYILQGVISKKKITGSNAKFAYFAGDKNLNPKSQPINQKNKV
jgi:hypothetical protein